MNSAGSRRGKGSFQKVPTGQNLGAAFALAGLNDLSVINAQTALYGHFFVGMFVGKSPETNITN
jgi:hypothetical protein